MEIQARAAAYDASLGVWYKWIDSRCIMELNEQVFQIVEIESGTQMKEKYP